MKKLRIFSVVLVLIQLVTNIILIKSKKNKTTMPVVLFIVSTMYLLVAAINTLIVCDDV